MSGGSTDSVSVPEEHKGDWVSLHWQVEGSVPWICDGPPLDAVCNIIVSEAESGKLVWSGTPAARDNMPAILEVVNLQVTYEYDKRLWQAPEL